MWTCEMPNDDGTARNWMALYMCIVSKRQITAGKALVDMGIMSKADTKTKEEMKEYKHNKRKIFDNKETEEIYKLLKTGTPISSLAKEYNTSKNALRARVYRYKKKLGAI